MSSWRTSDFPHTHARSTDPPTSLKAAELAEYRAGSHKAIILEAMTQSMKALHFEEIAALTGLKDSQVWKRLPDLERDGFLRPTKRERKTSSGANARLWTAVKEPDLFD